MSEVNDLRKELFSNVSLLTECGYTKPINKVELQDKSSIIQCITLHKVVLSCLTELVEFQKGLSALGDSELLHSFYCNEYTEMLTAGALHSKYCYYFNFDFYCYL